MEKLRFEFTLLPGGSEGKSNVLCVTSVTTVDDVTYKIPDEFQSASLHTELVKTKTYDQVKKSLAKRFQVRRVWIKMTDELRDTYIDEDGNVQFQGQFLEEINCENSSAIQKKENSSLEELLKKLLEDKKEDKELNLKNIADRFIIEKFTSKHTNVCQWIDIFENECSRFGVNTDETKIELLRLFLDKSCSDWYSSMNIKLTVHAEWAVWKKKFCETFSNKGWNPVTNAILFRYKEGSLLDYAIKKEKLLLEMRSSIDTGTMIDLIAAGLPEFILNKIDREEVDDTVGLFNELGKHEHMVNKGSYYPKKTFFNRNIRANSKINTEYTPCKNCEKLNKGVRYHPEATCWFKTSEDDKAKKNYIRHVNNTKIEAELNNADKKNE